MNPGFWTSDRFAVLAFVAAFALLAGVLVPGPIDALERRLYDLGVRTQDREPSNEIVIVAIDAESIEKMGPLPWSPMIYAGVIRQLNQAGARVIATTDPFEQIRNDPALAAIDQLAEFLSTSPLTQAIPDEVRRLSETIRARALADPSRRTELEQIWLDTVTAQQYATEIAELQRQVKLTRQRASGSEELRESIRESGALALPVRLDAGRKETLKAGVTRFSIRQTASAADIDAGLPHSAIAVDSLAAGDLLEVAAGLGHFNLESDADGTLRSLPLVISDGTHVFPSLALTVAALATGVSPLDLKLTGRSGFSIDGLDIRTSPDRVLRPQFYPTRNGVPPFATYSFHDVLEDRVAAEDLHERVVLIGDSRVDRVSEWSTPLGQHLTPVTMLAHAVSSLLQAHDFIRPNAAPLVQLILMAAFALALVRLRPRFSLGSIFVLAVTLAALLLLAEWMLLSLAGIWLQLILPATAIALSPAFLLLHGIAVKDFRRLRGDAASAETNRKRALALQDEGELDRAFETFKRVRPQDDQLMHLLYNLALDYQREHRYARAEAVYGFISSRNGAFRDVLQARERMHQLAEHQLKGVIESATGQLATLPMDENGHRVLGRYRIERELGHGAMGVVYLGLDLKIGRRLALKTMALSREFSADDLPGIKARFFREAEAAGKLAHPNIVQIFEAGEERDLAYIAMEFVEGHDLTRHARPDQLLPLAEVLEYLAVAADALSYAHARQVIHRDIKPANLMIAAESRMLKVLDFGVARADGSTRARHGMVLGSPSYMSPEQLAGKTLDGRSDLFSLGVTAYQLLTGELPFQADSIDGLMSRISTQAHRPIRSLRPELPAALERVINRTLQKHYIHRYSSGADLARELRNVSRLLR